MFKIFLYVTFEKAKVSVKLFCCCKGGKCENDHVKVRGATRNSDELVG